MNEEQAVQALTILGANWPHLRQLDEIGIELWWRNALRHTSLEGTDTKPSATAVVDRLVETMTFAPKPHDWVQADKHLRAELRRAQALDVRQLTAPPADMAAAAKRVKAIRAEIFPKDDTDA